MYLDELAEELISLGIFENAKKISPGVWHGDLDTSRIFNHDEMPQFIDYGVSSSGSRGLVYAAKGEECKRYRDENRKCVTIEPYVSLAGEMISVQVIFPGTCISSSMAPDSAVEKIKGLMVSTTDSGYQDGRTCLESHKNFAKELKKNPNVKFPVCVLTDGHSSRFDPDVMFYCRKEQLNQYVSLADATELLQQLDQVFANLHRCYSVRAEELFEGDYAKVKALDANLARHFGFSSTVAVSGQTYTRKIDEQLVSLLAGIASSASKFANDMRLLMHLRELEEPFQKNQIGSSAMAYKRNPMRSERICSLAKSYRPKWVC